MLQKIFHTYWTRLLATAMVFVSVALTSKFLGAEGKGLTSLIATNILFINLVNEMVGGVALIYLIPRRNAVSLLAPSVIFAVFNSLILAALFHFLKIVPAEYTVHLYALSVLQTLNNVTLYVLLGKEKINAHNYLFLLKAALNMAYLAVFFLVIKEQTVSVFINALYVSNAVTFFIACIYLLPLIQWNTGWQNAVENFREMFRYSGMAQMANIVQTLNYRMSFYLLAIYLDHAAVGIYSVALALCDVVWMLAKSIGTVQLTSIANMKDAAQSPMLTKKFLRFSVASSLLLLIPALLVPESFYALIFGNEFTAVKEVLFFLAAGIVIFSINIILANHFAGTGRYGINLIASVIGLAVNVSLNLLLIPRYGITGAGLAATVTYGSITLFTWLMFRHESPVSLRDLVINQDDVRKLAMKIRGGNV